ncbi:MAG: putative metal-dependent hydrolase [Herbinix sp.]|nr:putative metal-dependent hydrolase [Herbinix sp.]
MKQLIINDIKISVEKKNIKNLYLKVLPPDGQVHISAPKRMTDQQINSFANSKLDWIINQKEKFIQQPEQKVLSYVTGEVISLWNKDYQLEVLNTDKKSKVIVKEDKIYLYVQETSDIDLREKLINTWYYNQLKNIIPFLSPQWEEKIGVHAKEWSIRNMKTRWGTCNVRDQRICLNLQLAKKSIPCLEYVIVHELVHLLERSHNHVFKAYMDQFMPDWRMRKAELNGRKN